MAATAAPMFKKLSLELGGKNATIILDDANLSTAAKGAQGPHLPIQDKYAYAVHVF